MTDWKPTRKHLKNYPHFDAPISLKNIEKLVKDPSKVAKNSFFPFLLFFEEWQPYRSGDDVKPIKKSRPIRFAARRDAYVFSYYRHLLSVRYERLLVKLEIEKCPIAYRQITASNGNGGGKCNIDFAKDAFDEISRLGNCVAIALDIKGYFENLDHKMIYTLWCELMETSKLQNDHLHVFRNITEYRFVDQKAAYRRLGYIAKKKVGKHWIEKYTVPYKKIPKQLCSTSDFRKKICGGDPLLNSIIQKNSDTFGIPQGAPISDLIANFYLVYFDKLVAEFARSLGGTYMRYSDDILLILPSNKNVAQDANAFVTDSIRKFGDQLFIKEEKTCIVEFKQSNDNLTYEHIAGPQGKNGFEYLDFRFDGKFVYVRESTISRLYRKVSTSARRDAHRHVMRSPKMPINELVDSFPYAKFSERFSRVRDFEKYSDDYRKWTFHTYLKRAAKIFGDKGKRIPRQVSNFPEIMRTRIELAINQAFLKCNKQ